MFISTSNNIGNFLLCNGDGICVLLYRKRRGEYNGNCSEIVVPSSYSSIISSRICLSDDAFCAVCHAVNDMEVLSPLPPLPSHPSPSPSSHLSFEVEVRCLASSLLGEFDVVSESYLDQTLDKKLMKMKKVCHLSSLLKWK